ncbi:HlyD family secretion protein [Rhizobium sp. LjRoot30]|uniref:HlyD family secretion protein n=1 Tax=Rhizobium sp. LjRoot30 TaxID=3342320 RepID=UPI003ECEA045
MNAIVTGLAVQDNRPHPTPIANERAPATHQPQPKNAAAKGPRRRSYLALARSAIIVVGIGLAIVVPLGWGQWVAGFTNQSTDNAYLRADTTPISTQISGRVRRVAVSDFQPVRAGQLLGEIDAAEYDAKVSRATAAVAAADVAIRNVDSRIELQHRTIAQADAAILAITADRDRAAGEYDRQSTAVENGWSTGQRLEDALAANRRFEAQLAEKQAEADAQRQQLNVLGTEREQAMAELDIRKADLALSRIELGYTRIVAPIDGVVNVSSVRAGQYVSAGTRFISIVPLSKVHVVANYKETQLGKVRIGQAATIRIDMFPGRELKGRVEQIAPATGAEFALLPADNATGNFTKVAQRIAVRIALIDVPEDLRQALRPGMSVLSTIHTDMAADDPATK